jgi:hypothetical protein
LAECLRVVLQKFAIQVEILMRAPVRVGKCCPWTNSNLNAGVEHLGGGVVERAADPAHRLGDAVPASRGRGLGPGVFRRAVGVEDDPLDVTAARGEGHMQGREHQDRVMVDRHGMAERLARDQTSAAARYSAPA